MSWRTVVLLAVATVALGGCGGSVAGAGSGGGATRPATPSVTTSSSPSASASATPSAAPVRALVSRLGGFTSFGSPTGNLSCNISAAEARCDAEVHTWEAPAQHRVCHLAYGNTLMLDRHAVFGCVGDVAWVPIQGHRPGWLHEPPDSVTIRSGMRYAVLGYGHTLVAGPMRCTMATTGVTCRNTTTGHGFTVSRESVRRW